MATYFISRHAGAIAWIQQEPIHIDHYLTHIHDDDLAMFQAGDDVIGILPTAIIADLNAKGVRYFHLSYRTPQAWRGVELSAEQLRALGACLQEFHVQRIEQ
ncbi:MAG: CRISPR-associated protein Csx16 [Acinetobacter sp.]|nr:CRISPR-associated protein Csx16 [Acinetobacter sp.]